MELPFTYSTTLTFFVNGRKIIEEKPNPESSLLQYLREDLRLTGSKLGCGEGGCGACTVMISRFDARQRQIKHYAVTACLVPICSVGGLAITTIEGIGSTKTKLHPLQESLVRNHGSQCGFCTPGMLMSMYALLRNKPNANQIDLQRACEGNLCRCTGYRSIIAGFEGCNKENCCMKAASLSENNLNGICRKEVREKCERNCCNKADISIENAINGVCKSLLVNKICQGKQVDESRHSSQDIIFPPELMLLQNQKRHAFHVRGENITWTKVVTLDQLLQAAKLFPKAKLVAGNTSVGRDMRNNSQSQRHFICVTDVPELNVIQEDDNGYTFGSAVTFDTMEETFKKCIAELPESQTRIYTALVEAFQRIATTQIRNMATIGGHIMARLGTSDLNPILLCAGSSICVISLQGCKRSIKITPEFFDNVRSETAIRSDEVLVSVSIPFSRQDEYFHVFKQAGRRFASSSIVNAAMQVKFKMDRSDVDVNCNELHEKNRQGVVWTVGKLNLVYGGLGDTPLVPSQNMASIIGRPWNRTALADVCQMLQRELTTVIDRESDHYKVPLAVSFFFKFYNKVLSEYPFKQPFVQWNDQDFDKSAIKPIKRKEKRSRQTYPAAIDNKIVGKSVAHVSSQVQATGEAVFGDDTPQCRGEVFMARVLSQRAHAKILSVDYTEALSYKGVITYVDSEDVPGENQILRDELLFAAKEVTCVGQVIGAVIAETKSIALKAAKAVKIEYDELPKIITIEDAIAANSYLCEENVIARGSVSEGFAASDHIISRELFIGGQEHFYMEPHVSIASPTGEHDEMQVITSSQWPTKAQLVISHVLGVPSNRVTVKTKRLGGAFGGKDGRNTVLASAAAVAAHKTGRPVRVTLDREEDMISTGKRHPFLARCKIGCTSSGIIKALDVQCYINGGNSTDVSNHVSDNALYHLDNAYFIPNFRAVGRVCKTNVPSNTAMRGFGAPQAIFVTESLLSDVAEVCGLSQTQVREQNMYQEHERTVLNQELKNCTIQRVWNDLLNKSDFQKREYQVTVFNRNNRWRKRGIALTPHKYGIGFEQKRLNYGEALVHVYSDGSVLLSHGGVEMGQGLHTKMLQVASMELEIPISKIHIKETRTDAVPNSSPTGASVATDINGMAVVDACRKIKNRLDPYRRENPKDSWEKLIETALTDRVSLSATGYYRMPEAGLDSKTKTRTFPYFSFGAACTEVEIDCLTGDHEVLRTDIVMDLGKSLNPGIDIGQIEGAFVQGMGYFTTERVNINSDGVLSSTGPNTYMIPTMADIPSEFYVHLLPGVQNPSGIYSSKAVGEPPFICAISVHQAIKNAIAAAREEVGINGSFRLDSPATSEMIRMFCSTHLSDMTA